MASCSSCPEFSMFEKMADCTSQWTSKKFSKIREWIATEKIHGANFSLTVWEEDHEVLVKMAKRSAYLGDQENFFNVRRQLALVKELEDCSRKVWLSVQKKETEVEAVVVYGELFGGVSIEKYVKLRLRSRDGGTCRVVTRPKFGPTSLLAVPNSLSRANFPPVRVWHRETSVTYALLHDG